jgi:hypothetical protein
MLVPAPIIAPIRAAFSSVHTRVPGAGLSATCTQTGASSLAQAMSQPRTNEPCFSASQSAQAILGGASQLSASRWSTIS